MKPHKLVHTNRTERYLEELEAHVEDAGDHSTVGQTQELAEIFNLYAKPIRNRRLALVAFVTVYAFVSVAFVTLGGPLWDNNMTYPEPAIMERHPLTLILMPLLFFPGIIFYMPVAFLTYFPSLAVMNALGLDGMKFAWYFDAWNMTAPLLAAVFWGGITWAICFWPKEYFVRRRKKV